MTTDNDLGDGAKKPDPEDLRQAFAQFQAVSEHLAGFYQQLEGRVADLTGELELSRRERMAQFAEREALAARLGNLLHALPAGVVVLDGEGAVREFNPAAVELLGPLAAGDPWRDVVARAFAPRWDDGHDISLANGRRANLSTQALGSEPGQIVLLKDVTETRDLQDQLGRHRRLAAMGEMAAGLAHQIRTPLSSAILYLSNLRRAHLDESLRHRFSEQALSRLKHLERLVADMLLFARSGAFDVMELNVSALLAALRPEAGAVQVGEGYAVAVVEDCAEAVIRGNREALLSAFCNLIENAEQAAGGRGRLTIRGACNGEVVELCFSDDGPGVPEHVRDAIFEPFFTTRERGSGLGLAVAQAVVRAHGGEIALAAGEGACGTTFRVRLPRVAQGGIDEAVGDDRIGEESASMPAMALAHTGVPVTGGAMR